MSVATSRAPGNSQASVTPMQPLPVPTSTISPAASRAGHRARAMSTTISVSGLGMSTADDTANSRP